MRQKHAEQLARLEETLRRIEDALAAGVGKHAARLDGLETTVADLAQAIQRAAAARGEHDVVVAREAQGARVAADAGRKTGEYILAAVQSLVAVANEQARTEAAKAEPAAPEPEAAPAPAKPAARGKAGERP